MNHILQHYFNSRHIYCRLRDMGISEQKARKWARCYERMIHPVIYLASERTGGGLCILLLEKANQTIGGGLRMKTAISLLVCLMVLALAGTAWAEV